MTDLYPIDFVLSKRRAFIRFDTFSSSTAFAGSTLATLLAGGPMLVNPVPPLTAPIVFHLPNLPKEAAYFAIKWNTLSVDAINNTVLGGLNFLQNELKAIHFVPGLGASRIDYDGQATEESFLIGNQKLLATKHIKRSELRKISFDNFAVTIAHRMESLQSTTAFAPDIVGATNFIFVGLQLDIEAVF